MVVEASSGGIQTSWCLFTALQTDQDFVVTLGGTWDVVVRLVD